MSVTLFPLIQPEVTGETEDSSDYPMYREVKWDFQNNVPIYKNGNPVIVEGLEAIKVWAWKALHTPRFRYEIYSWDYGNELESLIGQSYSQALKESEAARYVRECLLINPYITDVKNITVNQSGDKISITGTLETIYGEVNISV
ncbi:MAG: DUF2634 domain-containing protein [Oscillospiraceae bacterium]